MTVLQRRLGKFDRYPLLDLILAECLYVNRLLSVFQQVDLSKNFYFSYSYDLTNTLQINLVRSTPHPIYNTHFMWNYHLLKPAFDIPEVKDRDEETPLDAEGEMEKKDPSKKCSCWVLPFVHGFVDQASKPNRLYARARNLANMTLLF